ncbi:hypothetical protein [Microvirga alba]|uniref:Lipoprotein n=1 Tax=Microvirga alba TaxID=2791025 RepID=A0A931FQD5_9HYPH|nr:hypothetical protein [Microvirga alba]MBF9233363.1 hypothetical protein [Microvirga alba]
MKTWILVVGLAANLGACAPILSGPVAVSCTEFIGQPISERSAAYGPPQAVIKLSPTQVGYNFESKETTFAGGEVFYTVNYMVGSDEHRLPIYPTTTVCRGTFVVRAPSDVSLLNQGVIVDALP